MKDSFKRTFEYIIKEQIRTIGISLLISVIYGFAMGFLFESRPTNNRLMSAYLFFLIMQVISIVVSQITYFSTHVQLMLGMGCTRKSIQTGIHVVTLMSVLINGSCILLVGLICNMSSYMTLWNMGFVCMAICLLITLGMLFGYLSSIFPKMGPWFIVGFIFAVSIATACFVIMKINQGADIYEMLQNKSDLLTGWLIVVIFYAIVSVLCRTYLKKVEHL